MNTVKFLNDIFLYASPILLCTLGGLFAYRANIVNIGLEGMMYMSGFGSVLAIYLTHSVALGIFTGLLVSLITGCLFSYLSISKRANFIITGLGINMLAMAIGKYVLVEMRMTNINLINIESLVYLGIELPIISSVPILKSIFSGHSLFTYIAFLSVPAAWLVMYKTPFGIYVRTCGENENAGKNVGIRITRVKYWAIIISAVLSGFAGYNVAVEQLTSFTPSFTDGIGFIAIAAIYCGNGEPVKCGMYSLLFGLAKSLSVNLAIHFGSIAILLNMIPYLTIIVVLFVVSLIKKSHSRLRGIHYA